MSYKYRFKFIIVGETGVGKTCLLFQLTASRFDPVHGITIGSEYGSKTITVDDGKPIKLQIWDTAGTETFRSITKTYYRGAVGAFLVYDVTRRNTFKQLSSWLKDIREQCDSNLTVMVVGNKCDVDEKIRAVSKEEGEEFAKSNECLFMEVSASTAENVEAAFGVTAKEIYGKIGNGEFGAVEESTRITMGSWREKRIVSKRFNLCCTG